MKMFHGLPICRNGNSVVWQFPNGKTGIISAFDADGLLREMREPAYHHPNRKISVTL